MNLNNIEIIKKIETDVFSTTANEIKEYKKFNKLWINSAMSFSKIKNDKIPGIQFYPTLKIKYWLRFIIELFLTKSKRKTNIGNLLGLYLSWFFLKKNNASLKADYIYEYLSLVMFYTKEKYLIKTCHETYPWHEGIRKEVKRQSLALGIVGNNDFIGIPKIIAAHLDSNQPYFIQELILGKDLNGINKNRQSEIYKLVFRTMFTIYSNSDIKFIKKPLTINFEFIKRLQEYCKPEKEIDIFKNIKDILKKDLFLPFCFLHADLKGSNLIIDSKNKIWIIDWLGAKENYMIFELDNSIINLKECYDQFFTKIEYHNVELYNYNEQIVLKKLILLQNQLNFENVNQKRIDMLFKDLERFIVKNIINY